VSLLDDDRVVAKLEGGLPGFDHEDLAVGVLVSFGPTPGPEWTRMIENGTSPCSAPTNSWEWRVWGRSSRAMIAGVSSVTVARSFGGNACAAVLHPIDR